MQRHTGLLMSPGAFGEAPRGVILAFYLQGLVTTPHALTKWQMLFASSVSHQAR